ncbi:hypothetical protein GCM10028818_56730 [Spirosoma horti]
MTLYAFNLLSLEKQLASAFQNGTFLVTRRVGISYLCLYALETFYVEIRYSQDLNQITACRSFQSSIALEPYLEQINLDVYPIATNS